MSLHLNPFRTLLLALVAMGIAVNGSPVAAPCAGGIARAGKLDGCGNCCGLVGETAGGHCTRACCQSPDSVPDVPKSAPVPIRLDLVDATARLVDDALFGIGGLQERRSFGPAVPTSGTPSLVTHHVRLQT